MKGKVIAHAKPGVTRLDIPVTFGKDVIFPFKLKHGSNEYAPSVKSYQLRIMDLRSPNEDHATEVNGRFNGIGLGAGLDLDKYLIRQYNEARAGR